jgi:uncharacterized protein YgbK (DUF1537 family)
MEARQQIAACLENNGLSAVGMKEQQLEQLAVLCFDSVDAVLYVDKLRKYHITEADKEVSRDLGTIQCWVLNSLCFMVCWGMHVPLSTG